jgi:hypothetical protein
MAVRSSTFQSNMVVRFKNGVDATGNDIIKSQRFSKIKVNALDEDILTVGTELGTLLKYPFADVVKENHSFLINE